MTATEQAPVAARRISKFTFEVRAAEPTDDADERSQRRSDALAAWLMAEWEREQRQRMAERN